jgi:hypothetical protein
MSLLSLSAAARGAAARLQHARPAAVAAFRCLSTDAAAAAAVQPAAGLDAAAAAAVSAASSAAAESAAVPVSIPRLRLGSSKNLVSFALPKTRAGAASAAAAAAAALQSYPLDTSVGLVRACSSASFDETVSLALKLNLDPRKPNQSVRGAAALPHGTGKTVRVAVFAKGEKAQEAQAAGADIVGEKDLVDQVRAARAPAPAATVCIAMLLEPSHALTCVPSSLSASLPVFRFSPARSCSSAALPLRT